MSENDCQEMPLSPDAQMRIDAACVRFEDAWKAGNRPAIEEHLASVGPGPERDVLFEELLLLEREYRRRHGEEPSPGEYIARFPEYADRIAKHLPAQSSGASRVLLTVTEGPHVGETFTFDRHETFLVGRSRRANFRLSDKDDAISRLHFMIEVNPPKCRLIDMGSSNGTYVNGVRTEAADLADGDVIKAGKTIIRVTLELAESETVTRSVVSEDALSDTTQGFPSSPEPDVEQPARASIPGYRLLRKLGGGGMGDVFLAEREGRSSPVALKLIRPDAAASSKAIDMFLREAEILGQLEHPNIVRFHESGKAGDLIYLTMDYVEGSDAKTLLAQEKPLAVGRVVRWLRQLLAALEHAHARRFVHRDVKPANIMIASVNGTEHAMLVDFGLARVYQASAVSGLTMAGQFGGTAAFMAPDQILDFRGASPAVDQYAAGATLYNLLTGAYPFDFPKSLSERISMILNGTPIAITRRRADLPSELAKVIHKTLAKDPADRFPSVDALSEALKPFECLA